MARKSTLKPTRKISIRLLKAAVKPEDAVRDGTDLQKLGSIPGAFVALGRSGGDPPRWTDFLELSPDQKKKLYNVSAYGLVFLKTKGRWFAIAFGSGFQRLEASSFEHDFGLRVVINSVDEKKLRSADVRTPDDNTTTTRTQASRQSSQDIFEIDHERDLVRGLEGVPKDSKFASRVSGSDAAILWRRAALSDLPTICAEALAVSERSEYKDHFKWIDDIRHERDSTIVSALDKFLAVAVQDALATDRSEALHLAWPIIYSVETASHASYSGFRSAQVFDDLDIRNYLDELADKGITKVTAEDLERHHIQQTDEDGSPAGERFTVRDCLVYETEYKTQKYVLSGGRWYQVSKSLAAEVLAFFNKAPTFEMPAANDENEQDYNLRLEKEKTKEWVKFDAKPIKPTDAATPIEVCDFYAPGLFIHIKDQAASSKLSHLFNQGQVSAQTFKTDPEFRELVKAKASEISGGKLGGDLPGKDDAVIASNFTVVFTVLRDKPARGKPVLPFFSLVTFRQAAKRIEGFDFKYAFAWVLKDKPGTGKAKKRKTKGAGEEE